MGWFSDNKQGVSMTLREHEQLVKEIAELNEKKGKLKAVIDSAVKEATVNLEKDYLKKAESLEVTYQSKLKILAGEVASITKEKGV